MQRQVDAAIRRAQRAGLRPIEIRLGEAGRAALLEEVPRTSSGLYRKLPIVPVATADHASLKVSDGPHLEIS